MLVGRTMRTVGRIACEITTDIEGGGFRIAQFSEEHFIGGIPLVLPFRLPVVFHSVFQLVIPDNGQVEVHDWNLYRQILAFLVQIKHRVALATHHRCAAENQAKGYISYFIDLFHLRR